MPAPCVTLIAALSADGFLADEHGRIPWHMPRDVEHFRTYCAGKALLMGGTTAQQMQGWGEMMARAGRAVRTHVLSRQAGFGMPEALAQATQAGEPELVCVGGAQAYAAALPWADCLILSEIGLRLGSGLRFPVVEFTLWKLWATHTWPRDCLHAQSFTLRCYAKVGFTGSLPTIPILQPNTTL
jgi:dihydrofolate reductase